MKLSTKKLKLLSYVFFATTFFFIATELFYKSNTEVERAKFPLMGLAFITFLTGIFFMLAAKKNRMY